MEIDRLRPDLVGPPSLPEISGHRESVKPYEPPKPSFAEHLQQECERIGCRTRFSSHAQMRVEARDIDLQPEQLARIDRAIDSVADKGAAKALVMLDDMALIVGVQNRTVITVVDAEHLKDNVFTSIDSAVIA
jgi:flagellar operon protein